MALLALALAALLLASCSRAQSMLPQDVVTLEDRTFEHYTQAATGQTTGRW
jgi:hypothetical protein